MHCLNTFFFFSQEEPKQYNRLAKYGDFLFKSRTGYKKKNKMRPQGGQKRGQIGSQEGL